MRSRLAAAAAVTVMSLLVAGSGCSAVKSATTGTETPSPTTVTVFAAASMKTTFAKLGALFEAGHPAVRVTFNFAGSQTLAEQLSQGAPADVFASANEANMTTVAKAGLNAGPSRPYATNRLSIAVPPDNPTRITAFKDLAKPGLKLVVCAPAVPCGAAAATLERVTGVSLSPVSEEQAVSDVMAKVLSGEADAGLVYQTDVIAAAGKVTGVDFPESALAVNQNVIVALKGGPQAAFGQQFVDLVLGPEGQKVLAAAGFGPAQ